MSKLVVSLMNGASVEVESVQAASQAVTSEISRKGVGSNEWADHRAGLVKSNGVTVARISYNGRVWSP